MFRKQKEMNPNEKILDLSVEIKYYHDYFQGNSQRFSDYSEWKSHIDRSLAVLVTPESCDNFRRYIKNKQRDAAWSHQLSTDILGVPLLSAFFAAIFTALISGNSTANDTLGIISLISFFTIIIIWGIVAIPCVRTLYSLLVSMQDHKVRTFFFEDLLEIIDQYRNTIEINH